MVLRKVEMHMQKNEIGPLSLLYTMETQNELNLNRRLWIPKKKWEKETLWHQSQLINF